MPVTLTDEQVAQLRALEQQAQQDRAIAEAARGIWSDPNFSDEAKSLWKRKYPQSEIPDYDLKQEMNKRFDAERAEREEEKKRQEQAALDRRIAEGRGKAKERGYTDEAIERMEKMMLERNIQHYDDAMDLMAAREPKPIEATNSQHFWNHSKTDEFKKIVDDPENYAFNEIAQAIQADARSRNVR